MNTHEDIPIHTENLSLSIDGAQILSEISFMLKRQETLILMGKNGSGKTMLLKTIAGLFKPTSGVSLLFGHNVQKMKNREMNNLKKKIGYVFQKSGLFDSMTVADNVLFALRRFVKMNESEYRQRATRALERSGLKGAEDKFPSELSGGMQKRAGIARSIVMDPTLLFMDDPTAGLDPILTDAIANLILEIRDSLKSSALVTTHDLNLARKLSDRIGLIVSGKLHGIYSRDDFFSTEDPYVVQFREGYLTGPIPVIE